MTPHGLSQNALARALSVPPGGLTRSCWKSAASPPTRHCGWRDTSARRRKCGPACRRSRSAAGALREGAANRACCGTAGELGTGGGVIALGQLLAPLVELERDDHFRDQNASAALKSMWTTIAGTRLPLRLLNSPAAKPSTIAPIATSAPASKWMIPNRRAVKITALETESPATERASVNFRSIMV